MNDDLEIKFKLSMLNCIEQIDTLIKKIDELDNKVKSVNFNATGIKQSIKAIEGGTSNAGKKLSENTKDTEKTTKSLVGRLSKITGSVIYIWNITSKIRNLISQGFNDSIDYIETMNKFQVSMGNYYERALMFQERIQESTGFSDTTLMDYQASFNSIMKSMGSLSEEMSYTASQSLTQMALDYSSLFNVEIDKSMEKFQSALVGSTKPIRSDSGYDVTETTIGALYEQLGGTESVKKLDQTEKRLLRIISLMQQMKTTGAFEDLARTINSPANQLRIFQDQLAMFLRDLASGMVNTIGKILPYINGFIMALRSLLSMFGFVKTEVSGDPLQIDETASSIGGIGGAIDDATDSAKEFKKQLFGWDVLNNITAPSEGSSGGAGGGGAGAIDPAILKALEEYNSLLDGVENKATEIRDRILGLLDPLGEGLTNFQKIKDIVTTLGTLLGGIVLSKGLASFIGLFNKKIAEKALQFNLGLTLAITGIMLAYKGIKHIIDGDTTLFSIFEVIAGTAIGTGGTYKILSLLAKTKFGGKINVTMGSALLITAGITVALAGAKTFAEEIDKVEKGVTTFDESLGKLVGSFALVTTGGVMLTSGIATLLGVAISPAVIGVGALLGALVALGAVLLDVDDRTIEVTSGVKDLTSQVDTTISSYKTAEKSIKDKADAELVELEYTKRLSEELKTLVDENGKVKAGNETRAKFILGELNDALGTEYTMNDNIIGSYQTMQEEIGKTIEERKKEILLQAYAELIKESIKEQIELQQEQVELIDKRKRLEEEASKINLFDPSKIIDMQKYNESFDELDTSLENVKEELGYTDTRIDEFMKKYEEASAGVSTSSTNIETDIVDMGKKVQEVSENTKNQVYEDLQATGKYTDDELAEVKTIIDKKRPQIETSVENTSTGVNKEFKKIDGATPMNSTLSNMTNSIATYNYSPIRGFVNTINSILDGLKTIRNITINGNFSTGGGAGGGGGYAGGRATGGTVESGQFFLARENGIPELVGRIGTTTTVMNNNQIVQSVSMGVAKAVASVMGNGFGGNITVPVYIGTSKIQEETYSLNQRENNIRGR